MSASEITDYSPAVEELFIQYMVSKPDLYVRCKGILRSDYFDEKQNQKVVEYINSYTDDFSNMPSVDQIKAITGKDLQTLDVDSAAHEQWFLREIERFCRHKGLRAAILASPDLLDEGRYGEVEAAVKAAVQIGLVKDLGTDYYANPKERLEAIRENKGQHSTGWKTVDEKLFGGVNRGELGIFAGQSGAGKSVFLQNMAVNWATSGMNVVYLSLELSEKLCSMRIDAMHTGYDTREVMKNIEDIHMKLRAAQQKHRGNIIVKQLPNGCTANDIRAYIKEVEIHKGVKIDAMLVDYLDLMMPTSKRISAENLFVKDKYVTEELRNLAVELNILCFTASQLNRGSHEIVEFGHNHISGGISKINTADNVLGIFTTPQMKESGRYQIQFMKTRSSSGVGSTLDLAFDRKSLRITDLAEGEESASSLESKKMYEHLKSKSAIKSIDHPPSTSPATSFTKKADDPLAAAAALRAVLKR